MKRLATFLIAVFLLVPRASNFASNQNELKIWKEFVTALLNNQMTLERIRPKEEAWEKTLLGWLNMIKEQGRKSRLETQDYIRR